MKGSTKTREAEAPSDDTSKGNGDGQAAVTNPNRFQGKSLDELEAEIDLSESESADFEGDMSVGQDESFQDAWFGSYPAESRAKREVVIGLDDRTRISPARTYPWSAICALKIKAASGSNFIGTGWLIGPRTLITAGHCVYMHDHGGWARSIEVIPGLDDASRPFGSAVATTFRSVSGWTNSPNSDFDYGAIILPANARLGDLTGGIFQLAVRTDAQLRGATLNLSGYPGDKGGNQQWFHYKTPKNLSVRRITYDIDTMGGQSGSPVWYRAGSARFAVGVHTNGHSSGNSATRIGTTVLSNMMAWRTLGL